jgi:HSP20 family protein
MKLIRYEYPDLSSLNEFNRFLGTLFPAVSRADTAFDSLLGNARWAGSPAADLYEDDGHYYVKLELPGVKKEDVQVEIENAVLTVTAKRATATKEGETSAEFSRSLTVPEGVDNAKIQAAYENGVLTLTLPKTEARQPRRIDVA